MKKILSVLLSAAIIIGVVGIGVCAEERESDLGFAVASDLHYNVPADELEGDIDDEIYWYANRRASMDNESGFIIDAFLEQCRRRNVFASMYPTGSARRGWQDGYTGCPSL